ncbi:hypothetical protein C8Q80DRAFT_1266872 [Daedaleopsis nitida]|nr:hypothetical protein C8Q80DRAFT_1266872 [Daedaleopsis nitida]
MAPATLSARPPWTTTSSSEPTANSDPIPPPTANRDHDSSLSPPAQSSSSSSAPWSSTKRLRDEDDNEEDKFTRKTKWRNVLQVMQHDVETRKVSKEKDNFNDQARLIPRIVNPFVDPLAALMVGRARSQPDADNNSLADEEKLHDKQGRSNEHAQQRELQCQYDAMLYLILHLTLDVHLLEDDDIDTLAAYIKYNSGKARTTDFCHGVSERLWRYITMSDYFSNSSTSLEKWERDGEGFCDKVKDPESDITIVTDGDDQMHDPLSGFPRSKMFKSLWTGPISTKCDSARTKSTPGKLPLSHKYHINAVSARMLAYVAVLLPLALTTAERKMSDVQFNNSKFFDNIVALFEDPMTPWASETLEWWNRTVSRAPQADPGRKTIARLAREHHKAVRQTMKAGLDPSQITSTKKPFSSPPAEHPDAHPLEPVASSSKRRLTVDAKDVAAKNDTTEDDDAEGEPVSSDSPQHVADVRTKTRSTIPVS